jgi:DNA repair protein RAD5
VTGWTTRGGRGLLGHGETVGIERVTPQNSLSKSVRGRGKGSTSKRTDTIVRFTNSRGQEIGRLESQTSAWICPLIDQKICSFVGSCVYAPENLRTNETVILQLRCSLRKDAFEASKFSQPEEDRTSAYFESKETAGERDLRLRQVALVRLFQEINLQPSEKTSGNGQQTREALVTAAERADQDQQNAKTQREAGSSPPSEDAEDGQELEQDQLDSLYKKAQSFDFNTPEAEPPSSFVLNLRHYQKQALYWMLGKEKDQKAEHKEMSIHPLWEEYSWPTKDVDDKPLPEVEDMTKFYVNLYSGELSLEFPVQEQNCRGGILADEMGLGKTIEMLSLIHSHPGGDVWPEANDASSDDLRSDISAKQSSLEYASRTTLVVAPMSLLAQWESEAGKASRSGSLKAVVYYGNDRSVDLKRQFGRSSNSVTPSVIITSYGVVLSEFNQVATSNRSRSAHGGLFSLNYFRVILDEAHFIKNRQSKTAKACYEIAARHRWTLTGTPIVNRLEDLFSLVKFLRVEPWSNFSYWRTFITVPFESSDFVRALNVVQTVLEPLVLRRTKDMKTPDGTALVPLPPRTMYVDKIELSREERAVYDCIYARAQRTFRENEDAGTVMKSFTTIFAQILRLRQSCCHPILTRIKEIADQEAQEFAIADEANGLADDMDLEMLLERFNVEETDQDANKYGAHALQQIQDGADAECPICSEEPMNEQAVTGCWHSACKECLINYIEYERDRGEVPRCFNCREPVNIRDVFEVVRHDHTSPMKVPRDDGGPPKFPVSLRRVNCEASSKIASLIGHLKRLRREDPTLKSVVFTQFTSFMDNIEPALERDKIRYLRFDGKMSQKDRAAVLTQFTEYPKAMVLLISLRAGGVGLNLTCAQRVFMMDPWWSFAVEAQAIDRVHRMGQENEVIVHRFIVENSIEEKMLRIQDRKKFM